MKNRIPQEVIDHCAKFELCKGCGLNCSAPMADAGSQEYEQWLKDRVALILHPTANPQSVKV